jgi:hypothetical protein
MASLIKKYHRVLYTRFGLLARGGMYLFGTFFVFRQKAGLHMPAGMGIPSSSQ